MNSDSLRLRGAPGLPGLWARRFQPLAVPVGSEQDTQGTRVWVDVHSVFELVGIDTAFEEGGKEVTPRDPGI